MVTASSLYLVQVIVSSYLIFLSPFPSNEKWPFAVHILVILTQPFLVCLSYSAPEYLISRLSASFRGYLVRLSDRNIWWLVLVVLCLSRFYSPAVSNTIIQSLTNIKQNQGTKTRRQLRKLSWYPAPQMGILRSLEKRFDACKWYRLSDAIRNLDKRRTSDDEREAEAMGVGR